MKARLARIVRDEQATTWSSGVLVALGAVLFALFASNDYQLTVGQTVGIDAISAMGLTVVVGRAGQLALGQAGFMAVGAYAVAYGTTKMGVSFIEAILAGVGISFLFGLVVGFAALRLRGNYLGMATLAFGAIIFGLLEVSGKLGGLGGIYGIPPISFVQTFTTPMSAYWFIWIVVFVFFILCALYLRGRPGSELAAMRDDELAAGTVGVNNTFRKLQAFALSAVLGAVAGGILAANSSVIDPTLFQPLISFQIFLMIVIGGLGSLGGAVAGAAIVVWLVQLLPGTGDWAYVVLGAVVIAMMAVVPRGLAGLVLWLLGRLGRRGQSPQVAVETPEAGSRTEAAVGAGPEGNA